MLIICDASRKNRTVGNYRKIQDIENIVPNNSVKCYFVLFGFTQDTVVQFSSSHEVDLSTHLISHKPQGFAHQQIIVLLLTDLTAAYMTCNLSLW